MIARLVLLLLVLCPLQVFAFGYSTGTPPAGFVKGAGGSWTVAGSSAAAAAGKFTGEAKILTAGGRLVGMPVSASFASNAASLAVSAIRLSPGVLVVGVVAPWLLTKSLEYVNGQWRKRTAPTTSSIYTANTVTGGSAVDWGNAYYELLKTNSGESWKTWIWSPTLTWQSCPIGAFTVSVACVVYDNTSAFQVQIYNAQGTSFLGTGTKSAASSTCPSGSTLSDGVCHAVPAEPDFSAAGQGELPADVAQQLARAGVPIPVNPPQMAPSVQTFPYGDPYVDPVTGKTVQTKTKVTPSATEDDPFAVRLDTYNEEVAPAPAPDPEAPPVLPQDEQPKDPCLDNPNRIGCMDGGTPDETDLTSQAVNFVVNPVTVGGAGSCPANKTFSHSGQSYTFSYAPICNGATLMKPVVLALAWLLAAYIIVGTMKDS